MFKMMMMMTKTGAPSPIHLRMLMITKWRIRVEENFNPSPSLSFAISLRKDLPLIYVVKATGSRIAELTMINITDSASCSHNCQNVRSETEGMP